MLQAIWTEFRINEQIMYLPRDTFFRVLFAERNVQKFKNVWVEEADKAAFQRYLTRNDELESRRTLLQAYYGPDSAEKVNQLLTWLRD